MTSLSFDLVLYELIFQALSHHNVIPFWEPVYCILCSANILKIFKMGFGRISAETICFQGFMILTVLSSMYLISGALSHGGSHDCCVIQQDMVEVVTCFESSKFEEEKSFESSKFEKSIENSKFDKKVLKVQSLIKSFESSNFEEKKF